VQFAHCYGGSIQGYYAAEGSDVTWCRRHPNESKQQGEQLTFVNASLRGVVGTPAQYPDQAVFQARQQSPIAIFMRVVRITKRGRFAWQNDRRAWSVQRNAYRAAGRAKQRFWADEADVTITKARLQTRF